MPVLGSSSPSNAKFSFRFFFSFFSSAESRYVDCCLWPHLYPTREWSIEERTQGGPKTSRECEVAVNPEKHRKNKIYYLAIKYIIFVFRTRY